MVIFPSSMDSSALLDRWNIYDKDGEYLDMVNRTNNGLESYNRRFNQLFPTKPSLIAFAHGVEQERLRNMMMSGLEK